MTLVLAGLVLGLVFGAASRLSRFCLLRGLRGLTEGGDLAPLRAFALAMAAALAGAQTLQALGMADLGTALQMRQSFSWPGVALGGAIFGLGMVLANSCGARALVLLAGGNLRSLLVLLCLGVAAQAALGGVLAPARMQLQSLAQISPAAADLPGLLAGWGVPLIAAPIVLTLLLLALAAPLLRARPFDALLALVIGLTIAGGWWASAHYADPFDERPLVSLSYIGPVGDSLLYLMLATGRAADFGVALVGGTLLGAGAAALLTRDLRLEGFSTPGQTLSAGLGGAFMGFGGVLALGCSIGQGLSGFSTLALASLTACAGILAGALIGLLIKGRMADHSGRMT